ncbi:MAG: hypothetical protein KDA44_08810 [Planctomycetales bacterium]|nr:hypothetical protein [Planctomycetales bacterium]
MHRIDDSQYERLVAGAALTPLVEWSAVRVTGGDRQEFLNKFCTQDLKPLRAGQGTETLFTDVKGKIVAAALVAVDESEITLLAPPGLAAGLIAHLDRYCIREDVQFADATSDARRCLVMGAQASAAIGAAANVPATDVPATAWEHGLLTLGGASCRVQRCPLLHVPAWIVEVASSQASAVEAALAAGGAALADGELLHVVRIESGWPLFGVDYTAANLPQEASRNAQAVSFRKGCYLGQETVARIDALGHVNRQIVTVCGADAVDADWAAGAELVAGDQVVGQITSAGWSPRLARPLALAMVRRGSNAVGAKLACGDTTVEVIATPAVAAASE